MHQFLTDWVFFHLFLRKKMESAHNFGTFGCFLKNIIKKKILTYRSKYSEIPLEGNTSIVFFSPYDHTSANKFMKLNIKKMKF